jgi:TonB family protein
VPAAADDSDKPASGRERATSVDVRFEVGTDGLLRRAEVVRSSPQSADPQWALNVVEQMAFEPSPGNSMRTPVTSTMPVRLDSGDARRIDGRTEATARESFEEMLQSLPEGLRMQLQTAVLQLNLEGVGSASEAPKDLSIARIRAKVDGMSAVQILAAAEQSARTPGAARMILEPTAPRIQRD